MRYLLICLLQFFLDRFSYVKHFARQLHSSSRSSYRKIVNQSQLGRTFVSYQSLHEERNIGRKLCDWKITTTNCFAGKYLSLKLVEWHGKYITSTKCWYFHKRFTILHFKGCCKSNARRVNQNYGRRDEKL